MISNTLFFRIGKTSERGALSCDTDFFDDIDEVFAVETKFFCERVNTCGLWVKILSNSL